MLRFEKGKLNSAVITTQELSRAFLDTELWFFFNINLNTNLWDICFVILILKVNVEDITILNYDLQVANKFLCNLLPLGRKKSLFRIDSSVSFMLR